jgi:branched-chain amino acid transport system substrate-binding protein
MCTYCATQSIRRAETGHAGRAHSITRRAFGAGTFAVGLAAASGAFAAPESIKIGTFGPLTGPAAPLGIEAKKGIDFAVQQFNAAGGLNGKKVDVISYDDQGNQTQAISVVRKMIEDDGVQAIVDGSLSLTSVAASPVSSDAKVPMVVAYSNAIGAIKGENYAFRWASVADVQGWIMAHHAIKERHYKTFALLMQDEVYGRGVINGAEKGIETLGGKVAYKKPFAPTEHEFRAWMTEIKSLNVDSVIMAGFSPALVSAARTGYQLEVFPKAQFYISCAATEIPWYNGIGDYGEGTIGTLEFIAPTNNSFTKNFIDEYEKTTGERVVSHEAGLTYDATRLLFDAMKRGGDKSTDIYHALTQTKAFRNLSGIEVEYTELREPILPIALSAWDSKTHQYRLVKFVTDPGLIDPRPWYRYY